MTPTITRSWWLQQGPLSALPWMHTSNLSVRIGNLGEHSCPFHPGFFPTSSNAQCHVWKERIFGDEAPHSKGIRSGVS